MRLVGLESFSLEPASKGVDATLLPIQPKDYIVDRLHQMPEPLLARLECVLGMGPVVGSSPRITDQPVAGGRDANGKPAILLPG